MIDFVKFIAWVILIFGFLGGLFIAMGGSYKIDSDLEVIIGLSSCMSSVITFCFLSILCCIAENTKKEEKKLES